MRPGLRRRKLIPPAPRPSHVSAASWSWTTTASPAPASGSAEATGRGAAIRRYRSRRCCCWGDGSGGTSTYPLLLATAPAADAPVSAAPSQVPLELRCALTPQAAIELNNFSAPEYLFWFCEPRAVLSGSALAPICDCLPAAPADFNRNLPYDPVRPWKDSDGRWYATISADACNSTVPCAGGGAGTW